MEKRTIISIVVLIAVFAGLGWVAFKPSGACAHTEDPESPGMPVDLPLPEKYANKVARVKTNCGEFVISFFDNDTPLAVQNFIRLGDEGHYNNTPFHRIVKGFMVQTGDYTRGDGTGGESIWGKPFPDELNPQADSFKGGYKRGVVAMANAGPNTNGSQFFVMHTDRDLPSLYTIFGRVVEGMDTIDKIADVPVLENAFGEASVPTEKVIIENITIESR